jgi:hypothetical protein
MSKSDTEEFERLLRRRAEYGSPIVKDRSEYNPKTIPPERLKADKNASLDDWFEMLSRLSGKVMKKMKVEFKPDEGARLSADQTENIDHPYITFIVVDSNPEMEIKPRIRQTGLIGIDGVKKDPRRVCDIFGQIFSCKVQFNIIARDYKEATKVMKAFEDMVFTYTAYFKRNGVKDIRFTRRLTDSNLDYYRQYCSVRSIQYCVEVEKLFTQFNANIEDVDVD